MPTDEPQLLKGHTAVVTGASEGIGAEVVRALADHGADVAFCARNKENGERLADELSGTPGSVKPYVADMAVAEDVTAFLDGVEADLGAADILVNNVGNSPTRNFLYMKDEDWEQLFHLNLMSAVRCTRRLLPAMRKKHWGRVVMVATGAAKSPNPATIDYGATKAAMVSMGKSLAKKYGADGVLVNSVLPGLIRTPMWERTALEIVGSGDGSVEDVFAARSKNVPLGRYGSPAEVAELVLFLCSEKASYVTGAAIEVDGGWSASMF